MNEQQRIKNAQAAIKAVCAEFGVAIIGTIQARQVGEQLQVEPGNSIRIMIDPNWQQPSGGVFSNRKQRRQAEKMAKKGQGIPDAPLQQQPVELDETTEDEFDTEPLDIAEPPTVERSNGKRR